MPRILINLVSRFRKFVYFVRIICFVFCLETTFALLLSETDTRLHGISQCWFFSCAELPLGNVSTLRLTDCQRSNLLQNPSALLWIFPLIRRLSCESHIYLHSTMPFFYTFLYFPFHSCNHKTPDRTSLFSDEFLQRTHFISIRDTNLLMLEISAVFYVRKSQNT
jgi:hypothetical protein